MRMGDDVLAARPGYFPVSQNWEPRTRVFLCVIGVIPLPLGVGILILLHLLFYDFAANRPAVDFCESAK